MTDVAGWWATQILSGLNLLLDLIFYTLLVGAALMLFVRAAAKGYIPARRISRILPGLERINNFFERRQGADRQRPPDDPR